MFEIRNNQRFERLAVTLLKKGCISAALAMAGCAGWNGARNEQAEALRRVDASGPAAEPAAGAVGDLVATPEDLAPAGYLERGAFLREVLRANPSLAVARERWRTAVVAAPVAGGWEDPRVAYQLAPASARGGMRFGQVIELSQSFPLGGRSTAARAAVAEARAGEHDYAAERLAVARAAARLYYAYYAAERGRAVQDEHGRLLEGLRALGDVALATSGGGVADRLALDADLARVRLEGRRLASERELLRAQMNALLHRPPEAELPPPPATLPGIASLSDTGPGLAGTHDRRPELRGADQRLRAAGLATDAARRGLWPGLDVMASYNSMWADPEHRFMVGVALAVPLQWRARRAVVARARAEQGVLAAERRRLEDSVRLDRAEASLRFEQARGQAVALTGELLPALEARVEAARAVVAQGAALQAVVLAQRELLATRLEAVEAEAAAHLQWVELQLARGRIPDAPQEVAAP
jgi:outer membrane protein TolC